MEHNECRLPLSYPDISEIKPDVRIASMLYEAYAGRSGEIASISNYIYQSLIFKDSAPLISDLLECIAMTETEHFKLLGRVIMLLGANPVIKTQIKSIPVNEKAELTHNIEATLADDIEAEKRSAAYFKKVALQTKDNALILLLKRLAADEEHHAKLLSDMQKNIG